MEIVTNGLIGYWNSKQGVSGGIWENISPNTKGKYNGIIYGAINTNDGMYFDGIDDYVIVPFNLPANHSFTFDIWIKTSSVGSSVPTMVFANDKLANGMQLNLLGSRDYLVPSFWKGYTNEFERYASYNIDFNTLNNVTYVYDHQNDRNLKIYVNGFLTNINEQVDQEITEFLELSFGATYAEQLGGNISPYELTGYLPSIKAYNRALTLEEIHQNLQNGLEIGLENPTSEIPTPIILNISKSIISDEPNMDRSIVIFKFNEDVEEWTINVLGVDPFTGFVADSGGIVKANTEITAEIDWTELQQEGQNRINIYGKNKDGIWTPYQN